GEGRTVAPEEGVRRLEVKRYAEISPDLVWRVADHDRNFDVRFSDGIDSRQRAGGGLRTVTVRGRRYRIAVMFRTEGDLTCLVPAGHQDTIEKLGGLRRGQIISVEGTTVGTRGTMRLVLVDRLLTGQGESSSIKHQLIVGWPDSPRRARPKVIRGPGEYNLEFPCRYRKEETESVVLMVDAMPREEFERIMARRERQEEGEGARAERSRRYSLLPPEKVYRHIQSGNRFSVRFKDQVKAVTARVPRTIDVSRGREVRLGGAVETYTGLLCLIRAEDRRLLRSARNLVQGLDITVKGTTLPARGGMKPVLVDEIEFPWVMYESPNVWLVKIFWGDQQPRMLYRVGTYRLQFPCRHAENRAELLALELREVRIIKGEVEGEEPRGENVPPRESRGE
ncbi:MAG: hypothetical protein ACOC8N_10285, partial [Spirochaetota bacterium]